MAANLVAKTMQPGESYGWLIFGGGSGELWLHIQYVGCRAHRQ